jgi:proteic killer suppression protein
LPSTNSANHLPTTFQPPSNRLESLSGNLKGFWSIRINQQWRIVFRWKDGNAADVQITDYH